MVKTGYNPGKQSQSILTQLSLQIFLCDDKNSIVSYS